MSRRKRFQINKNTKSTFSLNITSLCDMFTIMLVFLLQSFAVSELQIDPVQGLRLPSSNTNLNPIEGVRLTVTKEDLRLGEQVLLPLTEKRFQASALDSSDPNFIPQLFAELDKIAKDPEQKEHVKEGRLLLQADATLPYDTLRKVLYTASMAGFPQLKMVTMLGN